MMSLDKALEASLDAVPGAVGAVANADKVLYTGAFGPRALGSEEAMSPDTVFRLASMTKIATSVAALQLVEQGGVDLETPVGDVIASFDNLAVLDGFDGDEPRLRPPMVRASLRHLLTHTSGLAYSTWNANLFRYHELTGAPTTATGLLAGLAVPLVADPGTEFDYGTSTDWVGRVVEAVSGQRLDLYFVEHLWKPLGLVDTTVAPTAEQRARCAPVHVRDAEGAWAVSDDDNARDPEFWAGGHSLYSTPADYVKLQQMLLRGGELHGERILRTDTVEQMFTNQIGGLEIRPFESFLPRVSASFDLGPGHQWGLGLLLNTRREPGLRLAGSGGWAGVYNTFFWVDRTSGVTAAFYTQTLPFYDEKVIGAYRDFERAVYA
jgi:methyl acetate hydrolase